MNQHFYKNKLNAEALFQIQKFQGKIFVIKYGGAAMIDERLIESFVKDVVLLKNLGVKIIIVHGGGKEISKYASMLNIPVKFVDGLRYTDSDMMDVVKMVLAGKINKDIVTSINKYSGNAIGICGLDVNLLEVIKIRKGDQDLGLVGKIKKVNTDFIHQLLDCNLIPVIAPIGKNNKNQSYNINADNAASAIAGALRAEKLFYLTDVCGVIVGDKVIRNLTTKEGRKLIKDNIIKNGMIPKIKSAFKSIKSGVRKVHILDGRVKHSIIHGILGHKSLGTEIIGSSDHNSNKLNNKKFSQLKKAI
jgi:acetylglutamate kinase